MLCAGIWGQAVRGFINSYEAAWPEKKIIKAASLKLQAPSLTVSLG